MKIEVFKGKPVEKLIEVAANAIGMVYRPTQIRKEAEAEAHKIVTLARAEAMAKRTKLEVDAETFEMMETRIFVRELTRQKNIQKINSIAEDELRNEESVSAEPVDEDWIKRFFDYAKDVSTEEMQILWGKILAGEVKQPSSYSVRTLEVLRNINRSEADIFLKIGKLALIRGSYSYVLRVDGFIKDEFGIHYGHFMTMQEAGLMLLEQVSTPIEGKSTVVVCGNALIHINRLDGVVTQNLPVYAFTRTGYELLKLIEPTTPEIKYLNRLAQLVKMGGVEIRYIKKFEYEQDGSYAYKTEDVVDITIRENP